MSTNDPANREFSLTITGMVKAYAAITPSRVRFSAKLTENVKKTVTIVPNEEFPFKVLDVSTRNKTQNLRCSLDSQKGPTGMTYTLTLEYTPDKPGSMSDVLLVKTDSTEIPEITIPVSGYVMQPPAENGK